jgi:Spy/CpxP family protein refolding chaperone
MNCRGLSWLLVLLATSTASAQTIRPDEVVENARRGLSDRFDGVLAAARHDVGKRIGLTDEQAKQIEQWFRELALARHEVRRAGDKAHSAQEEFPANGASRKEIEELSDKADELVKVYQKLKASVPQKIEELLTAEQKKKLAEVRPPELRAVPMEIPAKNVRRLLASPDGKTLAVADNVEVRLYRLRGDELLQTLKSETKQDAPRDLYGPSGMAFSSDGKTLAVVWNNKSGPFEMTYWNVADGTLARSHAAPAGARSDVVFSHDLSLIVGRTNKDALEVWRGDTGAVLWSVGKLGGQARCIGFSADAKQLYVGLESGALSIRSAADGTEQREVKLFDRYKGRLEWPWRLALSPDGKLIAVRSSNSGFAAIFNVETGKEELTVPVIGKSVYWPAFADDGDALVAYSAGGIVVWDMKRRAERAFYSLGGRPEADARLTNVTSDAAGRVFVAIIEQPAGKQVFRITE